MKYKMWEDEIVRYDVEVKGGKLPFMHCLMYKWNKTAYKHALKVLKLIEDMCFIGGAKALWVVCPSDDTKLRKFSEMMGFKFLQWHNPLTDPGEGYDIMIKPLQVPEKSL